MDALFGKRYEVEAGVVVAGATSLELVELSRGFEARGDVASALACLAQALAVKEEQYGPEHFDTALRLRDLAAFLERQQRYDEAEELRRRALWVFDRTDATRLFVADSHRDLARLAEQRDRFGAAESHWRAALDVLVAVGPAGDVAQARSDLAGCLFVLGRYPESVAELTLAARHWRAERHQTALARALFGLGMGRLSMAQPDAAIVAFEELAELQSRHGPDHADVRWARAKISEIRAGLPR